MPRPPSNRESGVGFSHELSVNYLSVYMGQGVSQGLKMKQPFMDDTLSWIAQKKNNQGSGATHMRKKLSLNMWFLDIDGHYHRLTCSVKF